MKKIKSRKKFLVVLGATVLAAAGLLYGALSFTNDDIADAEDTQPVAEKTTQANLEGENDNIVDFTDKNGTSFQFNLKEEVAGESLDYHDTNRSYWILRPVYVSGTSLWKKASECGDLTVSISGNGIFKNHAPVHLYKEQNYLEMVRKYVSDDDVAPNQMRYNLIDGAAGGMYDLVEVSNDGKGVGTHLRGCHFTDKNARHDWALFRFKFYTTIPGRDAYVVSITSAASGYKVGTENNQTVSKTVLQTVGNDQNPLWVLERYRIK